MTGIRSSFFAFLASLSFVTSLSLPAVAQDQGPVPSTVQGVWAANGKCSDPGAVVTLTAKTLQFGKNPAVGIYYSAKASPAGYDAIFYSEEGNVDNFEYVSDKDVLAYNPQGFGMGVDRVPYTRCGTGSTTSASAPATENRCGWLANLTPGDWWLVDRDATWTIAEQGTDSDALLQKVPDFDPKQFVSTQGDYGYGCACLTVTVSKPDRRVLTITSGKVLPLKTCKADKSLPAMADW